MDCIPFLPGTADQVGENIYELFKRHSEQVLSVIKEKANEYHDDLIRGKLPPSCLISMLGKGNHLQEPLEKYAMKIKRLLFGYGILQCLPSRRAIIFETIPVAFERNWFSFQHQVA
jgi:hypothetical protein